MLTKHTQSVHYIRDDTDIYGRMDYNGLAFKTVLLKTDHQT